MADNRHLESYQVPATLLNEFSWHQQLSQKKFKIAIRSQLKMAAAAILNFEFGA